MTWRRIPAVALILILLICHTAPAAPIPILLDTDIGTDVDDAYALALILASKELDLRAVTTVGTGAEDRAWMVGRFLTHLDRTRVPVAWGRGEQPRQKIDWQMQYRRHPAVVWNRTAKPVKQPAVELLYEKLKAEPGKLTIVAIGPLTNIARLLEKHPESKAWINRIVLMGGAVRVGYSGKPPPAEWNIRADVKAAQRVFTSGVPLTVAPLDATASLKLGPELRRHIARRCSPLTYQVHNLYQLWDKETPVLFDPLAVTLAFDERFCRMSDMHLTVDMTKMRRPDGSGGPLAKDERIDDIQFYVDPRAELLIDDVVLYEPAPEGEKRPYPKRLLYTGWFDTGKQGREWPGDFEIVPHKKPLTWDAAKSVPYEKLGQPWIRLDLRGERPLGEQITRLRFRYRLSGAMTMQVALVRGKTNRRNESQLKDLKQDEWAEAMLTFKTPRGTTSRADHVGDELHFVLPKGATLLLDDVLLYE